MNPKEFENKNPASFIENLVQSSIPLEVQEKYTINFISYNRIVGEVHDDYFEKNNNKKTETYHAYEKDWDSLIHILKYSSDHDEAGYVNMLRHVGPRGHISNEDLYIPIIDFAPDLDEIDNINLSKLLKPFSGNKIYIYDSGNSYHGILDKILDFKDYKSWLSLLKDSDFVDQKWLEMATNNYFGNFQQVLRTTSGLNRPEPKFSRHTSYEQYL